MDGNNVSKWYNTVTEHGLFEHADFSKVRNLLWNNLFLANNWQEFLF